MRKVLLLGASGSIGSQTLEIIESEPDRFELTALSVGFHVGMLHETIKKFPTISRIYLRSEEDCELFKEFYPNITWYSGADGLERLCKEADYDLGVNALVGFAGLLPSTYILERKKILCLANKESLVVGGRIINKMLAEGKGTLYPIDSEHVAIAKMLSRTRAEDIDKILITASGGSFRHLKRDELFGVTPEDALKHPNWQMGAKITIDSATMMNKGFEVIEAYELFHYDLSRVEVLMHDESMVHSLLLLKDGSYVADISKPDMRVPIRWALHEGDYPFELYHASSLEDLGPYHFHSFDPKRYPMVDFARACLNRGGNANAALNASNEEAVYAFLKHRIGFLKIEEIIRKTVTDCPFIENPTLKDLVESDALSRSIANKYIEEIACKSS